MLLPSNGNKKHGVKSHRRSPDPSLAVQRLSICASYPLQLSFYSDADNGNHESARAVRSTTPDGSRLAQALARM